MAPPTRAPETSPLSRSLQFGHYDLLDRVNVGGMAEIFRARERESGAICAVKRILPEVAEDEEFVRMFRDEARLARLLDHPNICRILDLGRIDTTYFLALQYVDGHDLRTLFDRQARLQEHIPLGFLLHVLIRVCEGLDYAHKKRDQNGRSLALVHRDVSPQNVLVGFDGDVKLIDFGIAKSSMKLNKTQVGTIKGKYAYMSPEQVRGLPLDHRSDIFSLGICTWELLTLKRLFASDNEMLIMERVKDAELIPPRRINPAVPVEVERITMKALARDVDDRYQSAADLKADLQAFAYAADLKWGREDVAQYMRRTFAQDPAGANGASAAPGLGEGRAKEGAMNGNSTQLPGTKPVASAQELVMADNKGSDLDVFEGLANKPTSTRRPQSSAVPPPPVSQRSVPPPPAPPRRAATQMGIGMPLPPTSAPPLTAPPRTSTPPIAPPPSRAPSGMIPAQARSSSGPMPTAPAGSANVGSAPRGAMVDMDWDDEDEKTHVYDKDVVKDLARAGMQVPPGSLPTPRPPAPPGGLKSTMMGMSPPLPPPSRAPGGMTSDRPLPPPPPSKPPSRGSIPTSTPFGGQAPPPMGNMAATLPLPSSPPGGGFGFGTPAPLQNPLAQTNVQIAPQPPQPVSGPQFVPQIQPSTSAPPRPVEATQVIRPKSSGSTGLIIGALFFAAAAGVGAYLYASQRPGNIVVNVDAKAPKGTDVVVSIDGVETCKDTTCRAEVKPGAHIVKVVIGETSTQKAVTVEPGKDLVVPLTIEVAAPTKTVLKITSAQAGVKVAIDDGDPEPLPLTDDAIKPGKHHLKFTGGSKLKPLEQDVTVTEGDTKVIDDVKLASTLTAVKMKFAIATKGAKVQLVDGDKKQDVTDGKTIELDPAKSYTVTATANGYEDYSQKLDLGDSDTQDFKVELTEKSKTAPPPVNTAPPPVYTAPPTVTTTKPPVEPPSTGGDGTLFINTLPKSNCVVNGTPRGSVPITLKLPPGNYSVTCVAKDGEEVLKKSGSATVKAGEKSTVVLKLRD
jgi:serine/threonine protein kinase